MVAALSDALGVVRTILSKANLQGRGTYEIGLREGITNAYPNLHNIVFSRSLAKARTRPLSWSRPIRSRRYELKDQDGLGIWLCGGGRLAEASSDEIDELLVKLNPVVVGAGIPLFGGDFQIRRFELADSQIFNSGVVFLTYMSKRKDPTWRGRSMIRPVLIAATANRRL